jgi:hypothetical protein
LLFIRLREWARSAPGIALETWTSTGRDLSAVEATMTASRKKTAPKTEPAKNENLPDPIEGRPDDAEPEYPRRNTEQVRDKQPGTMTREEIRERTHRNKE